MKNKLEIRYGILFALIVIAYTLIEHVLGFNTKRHDIGEYSRFGGVLVPILGVLFCLIAKKKLLGANFTLKQGIRSGFFIALVQTTITTTWFWIYGAFVNPVFLSTLLDYEKLKMTAAGSSPDAITSKIESLSSMYSLPVQPIFQMGIGIAYGVVFALIFSLILRTRKTKNSSLSKIQSKNQHSLIV